MSDDANPQAVPDWMLFPFGEVENVTQAYLHYMRVKREGFAYKVRAFTLAWQCWMRCDEAWEAGLEAAQKRETPTARMGALLFMVAHSKLRMALELVFSGCPSEARSIMRDAIEFVAHAHRISLEPSLASLWQDKDRRRAEWEKVFWHNKSKVLFAGLDELYRRWGLYSDLGSHANRDALTISLNTSEERSGVVAFAYVVPAGDELADANITLLVHDAFRCYQVFAGDWLEGSSDEKYLGAHRRANQSLQELNSSLQDGGGRGGRER